MKKTTLMIAVMAIMVSCKQKPLKQTLDNADYPIVISDIQLKTGHDSRSMSFTSSSGKFFTVGVCDIVDHLIKYNAIGDTVKTQMTNAYSESKEKVKVKVDELETLTEEPDYEEYE